MSVVIQKAKGSGTTASFTNAVKAGNTVVVLGVLYSLSLPTAVFPVGCTDSQGHNYFGGDSVSGAASRSTLPNIQTQSYSYVGVNAGALTVTVDFNGGSGDIFIYEITTPSGTPAGASNSWDNADYSIGTLNAVSTLYMTNAYNHIQALQSAYYYAGNYDIAFIFCGADNSATVTGTAPGWTLDTQGSSAVAYKETPQSDGYITDGYFTFSNSEYFSYNAISYGVSIPAGLCGVQTPTGNPYLKTLTQ